MGVDNFVMFFIQDVFSLEYDRFDILNIVYYVFKGNIGWIELWVLYEYYNF